MADRNLQVRVGVNLGNSASQLKALNVNLKNTQSEFKNAGAGIKEFETTTTGFKTKVKMLNDSIATQTEKMKILKTQIADTKSTMSEVNTAYENQKNKVKSLEQELAKANITYGKNSEQAREVSQALDEAKKGLEAKEKAVISCDNKLVNLNTQLNNTEAELKSLNSQLNGAGWTNLGNQLQKTSTSLQGLGNGISSVGRTVSIASTGIAGAFAGCTKVAMNFEYSMSKVQATSGATGEELVQLKEKAKEMGAITKFSASESAEALNYMAMAGWKTNDMLDGLEGIMNLAAASGTDLALASDIVTDALTAFGMKADESGKFADILASACSNANTNVEMMGETFKYCAPVAGALGFSAEDTAVAIGLMGNAGIKASVAGTAMRQMFTNLGDEVVLAGEKMGEVSVACANSDGSMRSLHDILVDLRKGFADLTDVEKAANAESLAGKTGMSGLLAVVNASEEDFNKLTDAINNSNGASKEMADIMNNTTQGQLTLLKSQLEGIGIKIGEVLLPYLNKFMKKLSELMTWFDGLSEKTQMIILGVGAFIVVLGPLLLFIGALISSIGTITGALGTLSLAIGEAGGVMALFSASILPAIATLTGIIAVVVLLYVAIKENFDRISEALLGLKEAFNTHLEPIKEVFNNVWLTLQDIWATIGEPLIQYIGDVIVTMINFVAQCMPGISTAFQIVCDLLTTTWNSIGRPVFKLIMEVVGMVVDWFKQYMPTMSKTFNNVMDTLKKLWDNIGKPVFTLLGSTISSVIEACKPILSSLMNAFGSMSNGIASIWNGVLKPVFDLLIEVCGWLISKAMPFINAFKDGVVGAMKLILTPIQWVIDKFQSLINLAGKVGNVVGGFVDKINPFKRSAAVEVGYMQNGFDAVPATIDAYGNMALSGQYYNRSASLNTGINQIIQATNGVTQAQNSFDRNNGFDTDGLADAIAMAIQSALSNALNIQVDTIIDGRQVAKATAKYMDSEINLINKRKTRLGGAF